MLISKKINIKYPRIDLFDGFYYSHVECPLINKEKDMPMMIMRNSSIGRRTPPEKQPTILWLMGGAWIQCPREKSIPLMVYFAQRGYTVASAEYRVSSEAIWPAQIKDVMTAVRYLRAHADELGVDENKIAVMGLSAGGHLTAMAAMNPTEYGGEEWKEFSSEVQAAVDMFGPTEISSVRENVPEPDIPMPPVMMMGLSPEERLIGGTFEEKAEVAYDANPINHISDRSAPMLILHGTKDSTVSIDQSIKLHDALNAIGHKTDMYILEDALHGGYDFFQEEVQEIILKFLDKHLK